MVFVGVAVEVSHYRTDSVELVRNRGDIAFLQVEDDLRNNLSSHRHRSEVK